MSSRDKGDFVLFTRSQTQQATASSNTTQPDDDFWDDSLLVRAYDEALAEHKRQHGASRRPIAVSPPPELEPFRPLHRATNKATSSTNVSTPAPATVSSAGRRKKRALAEFTPQASGVAPNLFSPNPVLPSPYFAAASPVFTPQHQPQPMSMFSALSPPYMAFSGSPYFAYPTDWQQQQQQLQQQHMQQLQMQQAYQQQMLYLQHHQQQQQQFIQMQQQQQQQQQQFDQEDDDNDDEDDDDNQQQKAGDSDEDDVELLARLNAVDVTPPEAILRIDDDDLRELLISWYVTGFKSGYYHRAMGRSLE
jgi:hypothetical protein